MAIQTLQLDALSVLAGERLGRLKRPEAIHLVQHDALPRNAVGKIRKDVLRAQLARSSLSLEK